EGTHILTTVDGIHRTVSKASLRRNLKLRDEDGIVSIPNTELFDNLTLMGYNISQNQKLTFQKEGERNYWQIIRLGGSSACYQFSMPCEALSREISSSVLRFNKIMARLQFCDYHNMVAILEKSENNVDFHPIVDFVEASLLRYALTFKSTIYVSHIRQFWSTARIETTKEGTKILATVDGILRIVTESSLRRNLNLKYEEGIRFLLDAEFFENLTLMGYNISPNQKFTFQKGQFSHQWKYLIHTIMQCLSPKSTRFNEFSNNIATALVCLATNRVYNFSKMIFNGMVKNVNNKVSKFLVYPRRARIAQSSALPPVADDHASPLRDVSQGEACPTDDAPIKGRNLDKGEATAKRVTDDTEEMATVLTSMDATSILISGGVQVVPTSAEVATATQKRDYYMAVIKSNLDWKVKDFKGKTFEEIDAKFTTVWKQIKNFIPMGSKEEVERFKRKGIRFEQESVKKLKTSKEVKASEEVPEEKVKEMMQLVPIEEVYVEALQVKHHIIDWKHLDREDLNQFWALVKESFNIRPALSDKEMELWVELKRLYEPNVEDQLWTHTQNMMHALVEWKLYDSCKVHHVTSKDNEIFMLIEKDNPLRKRLAIMMICYKL
nr:synaptobrevin, longin-like domain protein [Tanacetum cinerariifolium]